MCIPSLFPSCSSLLLTSFIFLGCRITHTGAVPEDLLSQMFGSNSETTDEGVSLLISRKLVKLMNGDVNYLREAGKSTFIISVELAGVGRPKASNRYGRNESRFNPNSDG